MVPDKRLPNVLGKQLFLLLRMLLAMLLLLRVLAVLLLHVRMLLSWSRWSLGIGLACLFVPGRAIHTLE